MLYKVKITPIIPSIEIWKGPFVSMEEAWRWVEEHNNPFVDYEVIPIYSYEELYEKFGGDWTGWHG